MRPLTAESSKGLLSSNFPFSPHRASQKTREWKVKPPVSRPELGRRLTVQGIQQPPPSAENSEERLYVYIRERERRRPTKALNAEKPAPRAAFWRSPQPQGVGSRGGGRYKAVVVENIPRPVAPPPPWAQVPGCHPRDVPAASPSMSCSGSWRPRCERLNLGRPPCQPRRALHCGGGERRSRRGGRTQRDSPSYPPPPTRVCLCLVQPEGTPPLLNPLWVMFRPPSGACNVNRNSSSFDRRGLETRL